MLTCLATGSPRCLVAAVQAKWVSTAITRLREERLLDAGLMDWCPDSERPRGGDDAARGTEAGYRLPGGLAHPEEGEQRWRRLLEAVGIGVQITEIAAAVGAMLGGYPLGHPPSSAFA